MKSKILLSLYLLLISFSSYCFSDQFSIFAENDVPYHTDSMYTHGTRFEYTLDSGFGASIGQNMYTPEDKKAKYLIPDDRSYAGYLYGSIFNTYKRINGDEISIELQMGMVGPYSYAEQTQKWVHEHVGSPVCQGWENQIPNHFATLLISKYTTHIYDSKYFAIDPYTGIEVGNLADYINCGVNVYAGYNLPSSRNNHRVIPFKAVLDGESFDPYGYFFAGVEPKVMMYNMLLEDKRFTIHPNSSVYDRNLGLVLGFRYFELACTLCLRSKEFEEQLDTERFASVKISANF